jgi:O-antigen/teichoic acid export membrane protein
MIQTAARGSMTLMIGRFFSTFISVVGSIIVARILGSQSFGIMSIALIPYYIAILFVHNGTRGAMMRYIAEYRRLGEQKKIREIIVCGFTLSIASGTIVTIIMLSISGYLANQIFHLPELTPIIRILSLSIFFQAITTPSGAVILGFEKMNQSVMFRIIQSIAKTIIGPTLIYLGFGVVGAAYGFTVPFFITSIFGILLIFLNYRDLKLSINLINRETYRIILVYIYPLFFANILAGGLYRVLEFLLSLNVSTEIMGNYSAATAFSLIISFFTSPISTATFPLLSKLNPDDSIFKTVYQNIIKYESMIVYPVCFAIIALSRHIVGILYGPTYTHTAQYLQIYMISFLSIGIGSTVNFSLLDSQKKTKVTFQSTMIVVIVSTLMGVTLIPRYGVLGRLLILLIAPTLGHLYTNLWIRKHFNLNPDYENVAKLFISALTGFFICRLFLIYSNMNQLIEFLFGGVIIMVTYLIMILLSGALKKENLEDIRSVIKTYKIFTPIIDPVINSLSKIARK